MVLVLAVVIGVIIGLVTGGRFSGLVMLRIRWLPLLLAALLVQVAIFSQILGTREWVHQYGPWIYIGTLAVTLAVMLRNLHIPGMWIIAVGAALNALVITANGGFMPSPEEALREAGRLEYVQESEEEREQGTYVLSNSTVEDEDTRLRFLGDVIPIPDQVPLANVISAGDLLIALGAGVAIVRGMHRRSPPGQPSDTARLPRYRSQADEPMC